MVVDEKENRCEYGISRIGWSWVLYIGDRCMYVYVNVYMNMLFTLRRRYKIRKSWSGDAVGSSRPRLCSVKIGVGWG
jgi:hypothetical protein